MGDHFASSKDCDAADYNVNRCLAIVPVGPVRTITNYGEENYTNSRFNEVTKRGSTNFVGLLNQFVNFLTIWKFIKFNWKEMKKLEEPLVI